MREAPGGFVLLVASVFLVPILGILMLPAADWGQCLDSGTRRGRYVQMFLCSPRLLSTGAIGIAHFILLWAPIVAMIAFAFRTDTDARRSDANELQGE